MDFMNRGTSQPQQTSSSPQPGPAAHSAPAETGKKRGLHHRVKESKLLKDLYVLLLFSITILIVGVLLSIFFFDNRKESKLVDSKKYQAVFLNNGQVYFGKITDLNKDYLNIADIYYLRVNQQVQPGKQPAQNDVSLVKLGCELHGPQDSMVVNREQITFWENLKDDGQVAKAVAEYQKQNPNGQNCQQQQQQQSNTDSSGSGNSNSESSNSSETNNNSSTTPNN